MRLAGEKGAVKIIVAADAANDLFHGDFTNAKIMLSLQRKAPPDFIEGHQPAGVAAQYVQNGVQKTFRMPVQNPAGQRKGDAPSVPESDCLSFYLRWLQALLLPGAFQGRGKVQHIIPVNIDHVAHINACHPWNILPVEMDMPVQVYGWFKDF